MFSGDPTYSCIFGVLLPSPCGSGAQTKKEILKNGTEMSNFVFCFLFFGGS